MDSKRESVIARLMGTAPPLEARLPPAAEARAAQASTSAAGTSRGGAPREPLTKQEIMEKLQGYREITVREQWARIPKGTHIRYALNEKDGFRSGGFVVYANETGKDKKTGKKKPPGIRITTRPQFLDDKPGPGNRLYKPGGSWVVRHGNILQVWTKMTPAEIQSEIDSRVRLARAMKRPESR